VSFARKLGSSSFYFFLTDSITHPPQNINPPPLLHYSILYYTITHHYLALHAESPPSLLLLFSRRTYRHLNQAVADQRSTDSGRPLQPAHPPHVLNDDLSHIRIDIVDSTNAGRFVSFTENSAYSLFHPDPRLFFLNLPYLAFVKHSQCIYASLAFTVRALLL